MFKKPLYRDWVFWLWVALATIGGSQTAYRNGRGYAASDMATTLAGGLIDVGLNLAIGFVVFAFVPAVIRKLVLSRKDRRLLAHPPTDPAPGWKSDPLQLTELRWWNGQEWTGATKLGSSEKHGFTVVVIVAVIVIVGSAFLIGRANSGYLAGQEPRDSSAATQLGESLGALTNSLAEYNSVKVNTNDPIGSLGETNTALISIESHYSDVRNARSQLDSQSDLGEGAPDLSTLDSFVSALGPWISVRRAYYDAISQCGPLTPGREATECDAIAFDEFEQPMMDSIPPVAAAWEKLVKP